MSIAITTVYSYFSLFPGLNCTVILITSLNDTDKFREVFATLEDYSVVDDCDIINDNLIDIDDNDNINIKLIEEL